MKASFGWEWKSWVRALSSFHTAAPAGFGPQPQSCWEGVGGPLTMKAAVAEHRSRDHHVSLL